MATYSFRMFQDRVAPGVTALYPSACTRVIFCRWGGAQISGHPAELLCDGAVLDDGPISITGSIDGAQIWRFELQPVEEDAGAESPQNLVESRLAARAELELDSPHGYLIRCDAVNFPLGCEIYTHTHGGAGIRCMRSGSLALTIDGRDHNFGPGDAWFETGLDPVTGSASPTKMTGFVRVMVLPRTLLGKSSITYVREEDWEKPKRQTYKTYIDSFIDL